MKKHSILLLLSTSILLIVCTTALSYKQQKMLAQKMIRLHVVAQSDSETDQAVKLRVRDAVLLAANECVGDAATAQECADRLRQSLPQIAQAAEEKLQALGMPLEAKVTLGLEQLPTRKYDSFMLPAGEYTTLRVVIGEGKGHNWWCVVFPSLCTAATADALEEQAVTAGLTDGEIAWITDDSMEVQIRFGLLDWLNRLRERLF